MAKVNIKNGTIDEETRRPGDYDDDGEERTQGFADGGCDAGLEVGDEAPTDSGMKSETTLKRIWSKGKEIYASSPTVF